GGWVSKTKLSLIIAVCSTASVAVMVMVWEPWSRAAGVNVPVETRKAQLASAPSSAQWMVKPLASLAMNIQVGTLLTVALASAVEVSMSVGAVVSTVQL